MFAGICACGPRVTCAFGVLLAPPSSSPPFGPTFFSTFSCNAISGFVDCRPLQLIYVTQLPKGFEFDSASALSLFQCCFGPEYATAGHSDQAADSQKHMATLRTVASA